MPDLTIATLNLRGIHDRWWKRESLVVAGLAQLNADVVLFQEAATWCLQARWLAWRLGRKTGVRYHVAQARKRGYRGAFEGLAILSRARFTERESLPLGFQGRVAMSAVVEGLELTIANAHLDHRGEAGDSRLGQARRVVAWLDSPPTVLCGDLNDRPDSAALAFLRERFRSAHTEFGFEVKGTAPAWEAGRVIDYILVDTGVEVLEAGVFLDSPVNGTWPSDHVGLWAKLRV